MTRRTAIVLRLLGTAAFVLLIFVAAGTFRWPRLWFFLGFYVVVTSGLMIWLKKRNPGLLRERMTVKADIPGGPDPSGGASGLRRVCREDALEAHPERVVMMPTRRGRAN